MFAAAAGFRSRVRSGRHGRVWPAVLSHRVTRRTLLGAGLVFGAAALGAGGLAAFLFVARDAGRGREVLSDVEARFVDALADAYFPVGNPLGVAARDVDVAAGLDAHLRRVLPRERRLLRGVLLAFEQWPRMSLASSRRFSELPLEARVAVLRAWEDSPLEERRQVAALLRVLVGFVVFDDRRFMAAIKGRWGCPVPLPVLP